MFSRDDLDLGLALLERGSQSMEKPNIPKISLVRNTPVTIEPRFRFKKDLFIPIALYRLFPVG